MGSGVSGMSEWYYNIKKKKPKKQASIQPVDPHGKGGRGKDIDIQVV